MKFYSFIYQTHSLNSRQIGRQIFLRWLFWSYNISEKNNLWKMEVFQNFGSWDQEIDSWFTSLKPLIPTQIF